MKKVLIGLALIFTLVGCSGQKFDSYQKADDYLLKAVYDGKLDWDGFKKDYLAKDSDVSKNEFSELKGVAKEVLKDGTVKIKNEDNSVMIYKKGEDFPEAVISWEYTDGTYKVNDIIYKN